MPARIEGRSTTDVLLEAILNEIKELRSEIRSNFQSIESIESIDPVCSQLQDIERWLGSIDAKVDR